MDFKTHFSKQLGNKTYQAFENALKQEPTLGLIINSNKTSIEIIKKYIKGVSAHPLIKDALIIENNQKLGNHPLFHAGAFYIQDPSAMLVTNLLPINHDDKIIDLAAAPGGKSFQAAVKLNNQGLLIVNDINYPRAKTLSSNIEKYGFKNVIVTSNDPQIFNQNYQGYFDKVILDAPCSGEGMFRKDQTSKDDWNINKVIACSLDQKQLIINGYRLLKKGGIMVYSTCTFTLEENEQIIEYLLANTNAELISLEDNPLFERGINQPQSIRIYPFNFPGEGHFIALIKSNDDYSPSYKPLKFKKLFASNKLNEFLEINTYLKLNLDHLIEFKDNLFLYPEADFNFEYFNCLRPGLLLGEVDQNNFYPHHSFAKSLELSDFKKNLNFKLDDLKLSKYLKGETIDDLADGYYLVGVENMSLGLAKVVNSKFKNYYPKGLRLK